MRLLGGQVHVLELAGLVVVSLYAYWIGYGFSYLAFFFMMIWPFVLINLLLESLAAGIFLGIRKIFRRWRSARPTPAKAPQASRVGVARYIWWLPLVMLTCGYGRSVLETGRWVL